MILRSFLLMVVGAVGLLATPASASAAQCTGLAKVLNLCKPSSVSGSDGTAVRTATTCSSLARLLGCRDQTTSTGTGTPTTRTTTCSALAKLLGCKESAPAPAPSTPPPGVKADGSLDVGDDHGGLMPLPDHDRTAEVPAPLWPHPGGRLPWGFSGLGGSGMGPAEGSSIAAAAGANIQRAVVSWPGVEYKTNRYAWSATDSLYRSLVKRGIRPLFSIYGTPIDYVEPAHKTAAMCGGSWLRPGRSCVVPPAMTQMYRLKDFARRMAVRYPLLAGIEVWNEPNMTKYWRSYPNPEIYAAMVRWVDAGINTPAAPDGSGGRPEIRVIGGSVLGRSFTNSAGYADDLFLAKMLEHRAGPAMDGLSIHPYPYAPDRSRVWLPTFSRVEAVLAQHPEPQVRGIRLLATELGLTTGSATSSSISLAPADQAAALRAFYDELDLPAPDLPGAGRVDMMAFHTLADHDADGSNGGFGMVAQHDASGLRPVKHAFCAFRTQVAQVFGPLPSTLGVPPELRQVCNVDDAVAMSRSLRRTGGKLTTKKRARAPRRSSLLWRALR